jgi:cellulose synthase/poly-beta-1,6-N-acetylglucosamine synthase-like glycosyltransferase
MIVIVVLTLLAIAEALCFSPLVLLKTIVAFVIVFYLVFTYVLKVGLWLVAILAKPRETITELPKGDDPSNPTYSILVPLRGEASSVKRATNALMRLDYAIDKLEILLLLEKDDPGTIAAVRALNLPSYFREIIVPLAGPRTKPKACVWGYMQAKGDRVVIYDAEDRSDALQLLKAVAGFRLVSSSVGCLQATLSFWNPRASWTSTFYWAEYVVHYRWVLVGLARLGLIPPLGGTSNHFLRKALDDVARTNGVWTQVMPDGRKVQRFGWLFYTPEGEPIEMYGPWDPFNVTEDADLAMRLAEARWRTEILQNTVTNSVTYEEAPHRLRKSTAQGARWLKGYGQTGLVHTRYPVQTIRQVGFWPYLVFNLFMLGTPLSLILNPITWGTFYLYVAAHFASLYGVTTFIEGLFPGPLYVAGLVALAGNVVLLIQQLLTPLLQQEEAEGREAEADHELAANMEKEQYGLMPRLLLSPLWWTFRTLAAVKGIYELSRPSKRFHWSLSDHGYAAELEVQLEPTTE